MIKFIVAFILVLFDLVIGVENIQFDILPDFIGYGIMIYGVWKLQKKNMENKEFQTVAKRGMILFAIFTLISYIICLLDLYGVVVDSGTNMVLISSITMDMFGILAVYMYIRLLDGLQGGRKNFQVKGMNTLLMVKVLCVTCQYIAFTFDVSEFVTTFLIFDMLVNIVILVYMTTSAITYKEKCEKKF